MMGSPTVTDEQLITQVVSGNTETFGELVERYLPMVQAVVYARLGNSIDVDDIVQETFIKAYHSLTQLRERNKFAPWLAAITRNTALRMARNTGNRAGEALESAPDSQVVPPPDHARMEILKEIRTQVAHLGDTSRETIMLYYFSGHSTPEIAGMLETSESVVRKRLQRAREDLGTRLLSQFQEDELRPRAQKGRVASILTATLASGAALYGATAQAAPGQVAATKTGTSALVKLSAIPLWGKIAAMVTIIAGAGLALVSFAPQHNTPNDTEPPLTKASVATAAVPPVESPSASSIPHNEAHAGTVTPAQADIDAFSGDYSIDGGVMRPVGAKDVSNATVELYGYDGDLPVPEQQPILLRRFSPAPDGAFRITDLASGHYVMRATDPDGLWGISTTFMSGRKLAGSVLAILLPIAPFGGTVLDVAGNPVVGARVRPTDYAGKLGATDLNLPMGKLLAATTDETGHFQFACIYEGTYNLEIYAAGSGSTFLHGIQTGDLDRSFPLAATGTVSGRVINETTGAVVSDAPVSLHIMSAFTQYATRSDEDGNFTIAHVPLGTYPIVVEHDELLPSTPEQTLRVASADQETYVEVPLKAGAVLSGRIVDAESSHGIGDAQVQLVATSAMNGGGPYQMATTEGDGSYTIRGLPQGDYTVQTYHVPGYPNSANGTLYTQSVNVPAGATVTDIDFAVRQEGLSISGRLLDDRGKAHQGVRITVRDMPAYADRFALTDSKGNFSLAGLAPNSDYPLEARVSNYQTRPDAHISVGEDSVKNVRLELVLGALVAGQIVDVQGNAVTNAIVLAMPVDSKDAASALRSNQTESDGFYRLRAVPPGTYNLHINNLYGEPAETITVIEGVERPYGSLLVARDHNAPPILGRVVDEKGKPIAMADVFLGNVGGYPVAKSNESGEFTLTGVSKEPQPLKITHPSYSPASGEAQGGGPRVTITLPGLGALSGRVVDGKSNQPISDFSLSAIPGANASFPRTPIAFHDASGAFLLEKLPAGEMALLVTAPGYAPRFVATPAVLAHSTQNNVSIALEPGCTLSGVLRNAVGEPVADAQLYVQGPAEIADMNNPMNPLRSNADGSFRLVDISVERTLLVIRHPDYALKSVPLELGAAETTMDVYLDKGSALAGTVSLNGEPVPSGVLHLEVHDENGTPVLNRTLRTDANGYYHVQGLSVGQAEIHFHGNDGTTLTFSTPIGNMPTQSLDVNLEAGSAQIVGTIAPLSEGLIPIRVDLQLETTTGTLYYSAPPERDGTFQFSALPPGNATVIATIFEGNEEVSAKHNLDVAPEQIYAITIAP